MIQRTYKTKQRMLAFLMLAALMISAVSPVPAAAPAQEPEAVPASPAPAAAVREAPQDLYGLRVNGVPVTVDPMLTQIDGVTYASVRQIAQALVPGVNVVWTGSTAVVHLSGLITLTAVPGDRHIEVNGRCLYVPDGVVMRSWTVLAPLDTLVKAFDATLVSQPDGSFDLTRGSGALAPANEVYTDDDLYWLSHIIYAESGNQPLEGKIAVGNVVLNRLRDDRFPDTLKGVIFQKNQFSPAASGSIYREPNDESVLAAKLCLDGAVALEDVLYFNRVGLKSWASRNRTFAATIAQHTFYT